MSKKLIIMVSAGLGSFVIMFVFAWVSRPAAQLQNKELNQTAAVQKTETELSQAEPVKASTTEHTEMKRVMTEKQLKSLVCEVREKMQEYENKLRGLTAEEQRLQTAHEIIKKDIENLNNLRMELASTVMSIKEQQDKLQKSKIEIAEVEKTNLMLIAATYDKMDAASASKILANMCAEQLQSKGAKGTNLDDAVRILYYMTERTKAKLLAELVTSEPKLAAVLCQKLKQIIEKE